MNEFPHWLYIYIQDPEVPPLILTSAATVPSHMRSSIISSSYLVLQNIVYIVGHYLISLRLILRQTVSNMVLKFMFAARSRVRVLEFALVKKLSAP